MVKSGEPNNIEDNFLSCFVCCRDFSRGLVHRAAEIFGGRGQGDNELLLLFCPCAVFPNKFKPVFRNSY